MQRYRKIRETPILSGGQREVAISLQRSVAGPIFISLFFSFFFFLSFLHPKSPKKWLQALSLT
jgi:hypothetical protein